MYIFAKMILEIQLRINYFIKCYEFTKNNHFQIGLLFPPTKGPWTLCASLIKAPET
jgi:hypothetical protein